MRCITFVSVLRSQNLDYYVDSDFELLPIPPRLVPYQIIPLDPMPDCRLEMGIELIFPQSITDMQNLKEKKHYKLFTKG